MAQWIRHLMTNLMTWIWAPGSSWWREPTPESFPLTAACILLRVHIHTCTHIHILDYIKWMNGFFLKKNKGFVKELRAGAEKADGLHRSGNLSWKKWMDAWCMHPRMWEATQSGDFSPGLRLAAFRDLNECCRWVCNLLLDSGDLGADHANKNKKIYELELLNFANLSVIQVKRRKKKRSRPCAPTFAHPLPFDTLETISIGNCWIIYLRLQTMLFILKKLSAHLF